MDASEYRLEMERKFNNVMLPILAAFFGVVVVVILAKESGVDPKLTFVVSVLAVFAIGTGMMYWWNISVLPKVRELEKKEHSC